MDSAATAVYGCTGFTFFKYADLVGKSGRIWICTQSGSFTIGWVYVRPPISPTVVQQVI